MSPSLPSAMQTSNSTINLQQTFGRRSKKARQAQATQARTDAQTIRGAAERFLLTNTNADCPTVENLIEAAEISRQARTKDPWDHDFRIECQGTEIIVTSGGPDGSFGGEDDIH